VNALAVSVLGSIVNTSAEVNRVLRLAVAGLCLTMRVMKPT
jgi:hypothetical protein